MARNRTVLTKSKAEVATQQPKNCNCNRNVTCPLEGNCLTKGIVYQAAVTRQDNMETESYVGLTENTFKTRFTGHTSSFRNENQKHATSLSQYIWTLKDSDTPYSIKWKILANCKPYSPASKRCNLCLTEKYFIICKPELSSLNHRNELISACRHRRKHLLCSLKPP